MKRGGPLKRRTPLRARPSGRARRDVPLADWCEARTDVCVGRASHRHHVLPRSGGGNDATPHLDVCAPCHTFIHEHPALSYERGWLQRRTA